MIGRGRVVAVPSAKVGVLETLKHVIVIDVNCFDIDNNLIEQRCYARATTRTTVSQ
jgi:hypothetical protein